MPVPLLSKEGLGVVSMEGLITFQTVFKAMVAAKGVNTENGQ